MRGQDKVQDNTHADKSCVERVLQLCLLFLFAFSLAFDVFSSVGDFDVFRRPVESLGPPLRREFRRGVVTQPAGVELERGLDRVGDPLAR